MYLNKLFTLICIAFISQIRLFSQNLVLNPSFEDRIGNCNYFRPTYFTTHCTNYWYLANLTSPDYFYNGSSNFDYTVPLNSLGFQMPSTGNCYAGIVYHYIADYTREYIQGKISIPLRKNKNYCFNFKVSLAESSYYALDSLGVLFVSQPLFQNNIYLIQNLPDAVSPSGIIYKDTINWMSVDLNYFAKGGEQYFIIGYFRKETAINPPFIVGNGDPEQKYAYYYIDDVSITFCDTLYKANAGRDTAFCVGGNAVLGTHNFSDYKYKWFPSTGLNSDTLANPIASPTVTTTYILELKDFFDTLTYDTVVVYIHNCANAGNKKITCGRDSVQIGTPAIIGCAYFWSPANGLNNANLAQPLALPNITTTYSLTVTDNTGYTSTDELVVQVLQHCDTANAGADTLICLGATASIGATPIQNANYLWLPNIGLNSNTIANPMASPPITTNYILSFTDSLGLTTLDSVLITVVFCDTANAGTDTTICQGNQIILGTHHITNSLYQWSPSNGLNNTQIANPIATPTITTTYLLVYTDSLNNTTQDEAIITIIPCEPANAGADQSICPNQSIELGTHNYAGYTYTWSPINGLNNPNIANPTAAPVANITYTLTVIDLLQTLSTDEVKITIKDCDTTQKEVIIPNVFTPNNDGFNDYLEIENLPPNSKLQIFNRWGKVVFESSNYQNNWNGGNVAEGVYFYILKLSNGETNHGAVQVLK